MKKRITLIICLVVLLLFTACGTASTPENTASEPAVSEPAVSEPAVSEPGEMSEAVSESGTASPGLMGDFAAKDLAGNDVNQRIFADYGLTMVNVWATYCGPCLSEMPDLGELADEYESKGVRIVGMVTDVLNSDGTVSDSQLETARSIIAATGADYTHIIPSEDLYGLLSQITAVPTTFFVDSTGAQVGSAYLGSRSKAEWVDIITQTLEEIR